MVDLKEQSETKWWHCLVQSSVFMKVCVDMLHSHTMQHRFWVSLWLSLSVCVTQRFAVCYILQVHVHIQRDRSLFFVQWSKWKCNSTHFILMIRTTLIVIVSPQWETKTTNFYAIASRFIPCKYSTVPYSQTFSKEETDMKKCMWNIHTVTSLDS